MKKIRELLRVICIRRNFDLPRQYVGDGLYRDIADRLEIHNVDTEKMDFVTNNKELVIDYRTVAAS